MVVVDFDELVVVGHYGIGIAHHFFHAFVPGTIGDFHAHRLVVVDIKGGVKGRNNGQGAANIHFAGGAVAAIHREVVDVGDSIESCDLARYGDGSGIPIHVCKCEDCLGIIHARAVGEYRLAVL